MLLPQAALLVARSEAGLGSRAPGCTAAALADAEAALLAAQGVQAPPQAPAWSLTGQPQPDPADATAVPAALSVGALRQVPPHAAAGTPFSAIFRRCLCPTEPRSQVHRTAAT